MERDIKTLFEVVNTKAFMTDLLASLRTTLTTANHLNGYGLSVEQIEQIVREQTRNVAGVLLLTEIEDSHG